MQAIELFQGAYIEVAEIAAEELAGGLGVQLWLRPTTVKAGSVLFTLGADPASKVLLVVGERGALRLHVGGTVLVAAGALGEGRWTAVGVTVAADGAATLTVDGALAAVGVVPVGASGRCRLGDAESGAGLVVAALQVRGQGPLRDYAVVDGALRDAQRGTAQVVGEARVVAAHELPALRAAKPGALVLGEQQALELPALTADLTGGVTIEAWLRPRLDGPGTLLELGRAGGEARVSLRIEGPRRALLVEVDGLGKAWNVRVEGVLRPDVWQHVCVAIDAKGLCRVYVDTRQVEQQVMSPISPARDGVRTHCRVGSSGGKGYRGELAELRLWQGALAGEAIAARWLRRACGDEAGLVACWHLDEPGEVMTDASSRRLHARPYGAVVIGDGLGLPLRARDGRGGQQVRATGKLLLDHLPVSLFPDDRVEMPGWMPDVKMPVSSAHKYGTVQGSLVRCPVYEVVFEPRAIDGRKWSGALELRVDAPIKVLRSDGGEQRLVDWKPGATQQLQVSDSGRVRIKVLARSIDCPTLRVRAPGMDADCWTLVRPADAAQQQMRGLTARALQQPPPGKAAVLDPKMKSKDADALARFMRDAAGGLATPAQPTAVSKGKLSWGDVTEPFEEAAETVGDAFVELGEGIEKLAIAGVEETRKLAAKAAKTAAKTGEAVIRGCIGDAKTLAVDGAGAVWGGVQVIGERIVDGVKQTFRTVVAGVLDVVDAIEAFLQRIGASIREFIELLAMLFDWEKFLKKSDQLYDLACKQLDKVTLVEAELRKVPARLDELVAMPRDGSLAGKSIGEAFGIDAGAGLPDIDHLKYLSDAIEEAFSGSPPKFAGKRESGDGPSHLDQTASEKAAVEVRAAHPRCLFDWPWDPLRLPLDEFLAVPEKMWDAGRPVIAPLAEWLADRTGKLLRRSEEILRSRLEVPYLTDLIEVVILRGRKLDLMRLVALIGAVPAVICGDSFHSVGGPESQGGDKSTAKSAGGDDSDGEQAIRWIQFGFGVFNAGCLVGRAVAEWRNDLGWMWSLNCLGGASTVVLGLFDISLAARMDDPAAQGLGVTNGVLGVFGGAWMVASTIWGVQALATGEERLHALVDGIVEGVLGLGQLTTMSVAAGLGTTDEQETERALGFFFATWGLRGLYRVCNGLDNTKVPFAHAATTACAGAMLAVDLTDGAWALADSFA